ncbi:FecR domain-containing protein [uncultured Bacteroides sp.]|uniref:FecR family protein n=1 Tax=uncultured Bacteroides sp. TaxID=162156 RepID=UPI002AABA51E|nr:FecR domain-containing protein [uncultured Bacteroides sp.]
MTEKDYTKYKAADFAKDLRFISWQFSTKNATDEIFWNAFLKEHPEMEMEINRAIAILHSVKLNKNEITPKEREIEILKLKKRILHQKKQLTLRRVFYVATAACAICAIFILQNIFMTDDKMKDVVAKNSKEIQLIANNNITILPQNANIECKGDGTLLINSKGKESSVIKSGRKMNRLIIPKGRRSTLLMADGTKIWINSASEIEFQSSNSKKKKREIYLTGEAYLEVAKDKTRPFTVHSQGFSVEVLGTKFNVSAYQNDIAQRVVLLEGSVKVKSEGKKSLTLSPNQMATITQNSITASEVDAYDYISWKDGILCLSSHPLSQVFSYLERYYNVKIDTCPAVDSLKCNGKLILTENIESVLNSIESTMPIQAIKEDDLIKICLTKK